MCTLLLVLHMCGRTSSHDADWAGNIRNFRTMNNGRYEGSLSVGLTGRLANWTVDLIRYTEEKNGWLA